MRVRFTMNRTIPAVLVSCLSVVSAMGQLAPLTGPVPPTAASPAAKGWKAVTVVDGLQHPWAVTWLPDGTALITERRGQVRILTADGKLAPEPVTGVPEVLEHRQGGLMDIVAHPKFAENGWVYMTYSVGTPGENHTRVARAKYADGAFTDLQVLFTAEPGKANGFHFGSRIVFLGDGSILFSVGEGAMADPAQDMGQHLGKILRIMEDGTPATDNPFHARVDAQQEIWSYGHRNPQGMAIHPETGKVYATEHGPRGGDELNLILPGKNYGWPEITYGYNYNGTKVSDRTAGEGMEQPLVNWTPSIAASGLAFYTGDKFPEWKGDLFAGGLVLKQVRRVMFDGETIVGEETLQFDERIRDVRMGPDGYLYVLTDERDGKLMRVEGE